MSDGEGADTGQWREALRWLVLAAEESRVMQLVPAGLRHD
jgi:hypothetical protein